MQATGPGRSLSSPGSFLQLSSSCGGRPRPPPSAVAQWLAVAVAAISYVIWVYVFGGYFGIEGLLHSWMPALSGDPGAVPDPDMAKFKGLIGSLALVSWTLVVPAVYKGDTR